MMQEQSKVQLFPVQFHEDTVFCVEHNGEPYTAMRPIIENMGLAWQAQYDKLTSSNRWSSVNIVTVAKDGKERQSLCIPVRKLPAFLAGINPRKVNPRLRDKIRMYQEECDDALWKYWTGQQVTQVKQGTRLPKSLTTTETQRKYDRFVPPNDPQCKQLKKLIDNWAELTGRKRSEALAEVAFAIKVPSLDTMLASEMPKAIKFVMWKLAMALEPYGVINGAVDAVDDTQLALQDNAQTRLLSLGETTDINTKKINDLYALVWTLAGTISDSAQDAGLSHAMNLFITRHFTSK